MARAVAWTSSGTSRAVTKGALMYWRIGADAQRHRAAVVGRVAGAGVQNPPLARGRDEHGRIGLAVAVVIAGHRRGAAATPRHAAAVGRVAGAREQNPPFAR